MISLGAARCLVGVSLLGCIAQSCRLDGEPASTRTSATLSEGLAATGYSFPAEWERHESTWFHWWTTEYGTPDSTIENLLVELIAHTARSERVDLVVQNAEEQRTVAATLSAAGVNVARVRFHLHAHNEIGRAHV
mgnify:CR=1 FL=1